MNENASAENRSGCGDNEMLATTTAAAVIMVRGDLSMGMLDYLVSLPSRSLLHCCCVMMCGIVDRRW